MKKLLLLIFVTIPLLANSQDLLVFRNGERLDCKINKIDSLTIYYSFHKNGRIIDSFVEKNELKSYQLAITIDSQNNHSDYNKTINNLYIIDTSAYTRNVNEWINLITYTQKLGSHATGWVLQYYGYISNNKTGWMIPCVFGFEGLKANQDYFEQFNYQSAKINYWMVGIKPFRRIKDNLYLNIGLILIFGNEQLVDFYNGESSKTIFGIAPSQGIYFIPKANFGIVLGLGVFESLMNSEIYKSDIGVKFDIGIRF